MQKELRRIAVVGALLVGMIACETPASTDPSVYVGRYKLVHPDPDRSDLPSGVELRSDMTAVEFYGDERAAKEVGSWNVQVFKHYVVVAFSDFNHPVHVRRGEIRLYLDEDLDEYFVKPAG
jgi:hypothetical protein